MQLTRFWGESYGHTVLQHPSVRLTCLGHGGVLIICVVVDLLFFVVQICREDYPSPVCLLLWMLSEVSIVALDLTMVNSSVSSVDIHFLLCKCIFNNMNLTRGM